MPPLLGDAGRAPAHEQVRRTHAAGMMLRVSSGSSQRWLTLQEAAQFCGCSDRTISNHARTGRIRRRAGSRASIERQSLVAFRRWYNCRRHNDGRWVTAREAAAIIGCSPETVVNRAAAGVIARRDAPRSSASFDRDSVVEFAATWRVEQAQRAERLAGRRAAELSGATGPPPDPGTWLSVNAVAELLDLNRSRIYQLADAGRLPLTVHGGRRWFREDHIVLIRNARTAAADAARADGARSTPPQSPATSQADGQAHEQADVRQQDRATHRERTG